MMIGLLMVGIVGTLFYYMFDSGTDIFGITLGDRQAAANERQEVTNAERGAFLFARYCRACHGLTGQGAAERAGLPGSQLNTPANYPPELPDSQLADRRLRISDTIRCGRVGTQMPPWSVEQGGALNFFQIEQLVTLITSKYAPEGWDEVIEVGNEVAGHGGDRLDPPASLVEALDDSDLEFQVTDATAINKNTLIRIGLEEPGDPYELLKVVEVDKKANTITVGRGPETTLDDLLVGSDAMAHEAGATIYNGPLLPVVQVIGDPESDADPPCGQNKAAPVGGGASVALESGGTITLNDNFFDVDGKSNPEITVAAGAAIEATAENAGAAIHNLRIAGPDGKYNTDDDIVSDPDAITGGATGTIAFNLSAGRYLYQCDFHTNQMKGEIVAQ
jgi:mono/diheme cytochrome c family protein/plastocyanin